MRIERTPSTRPVNRGKNPELGSVNEPTSCCKEPTQIPTDRSSRRIPDWMSSFLIIFLYTATAWEGESSAGWLLQGMRKRSNCNERRIRDS
jgi:hypothetical protein